MTAFKEVTIPANTVIVLHDVLDPAQGVGVKLNVINMNGADGRNKVVVRVAHDNVAPTDFPGFGLAMAADPRLPIKSLIPAGGEKSYVFAVGGPAILAVETG